LGKSEINLRLLHLPSWAVESLTNCILPASFGSCCKSLSVSLEVAMKDQASNVVNFAQKSALQYVNALHFSTVQHLLLAKF